MSKRRYVVRRIPGLRRGDRQWVVWDNASEGWADAPQRTRRDAQDICDELEAESAAAPTPAPEPPRP